MNKIKKSRARRRNYRWTDKEIEQLIDLKFLDFLPVEYAENEILSSVERSRILKVIKPLFTPKQIKGLRGELKSLRQRALEGPELDDAILEAAMRVIPLPQNMPGTNRASKFLRVSLGLRTDLSGMGEKAVTLTDHRWRRRQSLLKVSQRKCFLEWIGLDVDLWNSSTWKECLKIRYEKNDPAAIELISPSSRRILTREARQLRHEVGIGEVSNEQLEQAATKVNHIPSINEALHLVHVEYLRARLSGPLPRDHILTKPVSQSGLFERIAALAAGRDVSRKKNRPSYVDRFLRYLRIPSGHADELVGCILYDLQRLESDLFDHPKTEPPGFEGVRWPQGLEPEAVQMPTDYCRIADRFAMALEIDRNVFRDIWVKCTELHLRNFWAKRASVGLTVYWAARLLEGRRPDLYRRYGRLIDFFHLDGIRFLTKEEKRGKAKGPMLRATLAPFAHARLNDPLLNCVFHTEVFNGRGRLFPRTEKRREDALTRSQMITYTVGHLRKARKVTPTAAVEDILPEDMGLPTYLRHAAKPSTRNPDERIQGYSHYAYAAVLVVALVNDPGWTLTADNAKDIFHRHKDDAEVLHLLEELDKRNIPDVRGKS